MKIVFETFIISDIKMFHWNMKYQSEGRYISDISFIGIGAPLLSQIHSYFHSLFHKGAPQTNKTNDSKFRYSNRAFSIGIQTKLLHSKVSAMNRAINICSDCLSEALRRNAYGLSQKQLELLAVEIRIELADIENSQETKAWFRILLQFIEYVQMDKLADQMKKAGIKNWMNLSHLKEGNNS